MLRPQMNRPTPLRPHAISGIAMDRALPARPRWRRPGTLATVVALVGVALMALAFAAWQRGPRLEVVRSPQLAPVRAGEFRDELMLRARAEPLHSVQLDAAEAGIVEAVLVQDGEHVAAGAPLYRLHSPEQEQLLMQRSAEVAQQMANASMQRTAQAAGAAQHRREIARLEVDLADAADELQRQQALSVSGFVSSAALAQAQRRERLALQLLQQARVDQRTEATIQAQSLAETERAVQRLRQGLVLLERSRERLLQRAPIAGQVSGLQLKVGAGVRAGERLGRIDDARGGVQLVAEVDEYWLPRLQPGLAAHSEAGALRLLQTLPQVQGGKVRALLRWADGERSRGSALHAGQAVDVHLQLAAPAPALLLPEGPGVQARLYVREGRELARRGVRLGRRAAGQVEVLSGLRAGDEVLISQPPSDAERLALP